MHHILTLVLACDALELACDSPHLSAAQLAGAAACLVLGHWGAEFCFKKAG